MAVILQKSGKSPYHSNGWTDCYKIWQGDTEWPFLPYWLLKIVVKNQGW